MCSVDFRIFSFDVKHPDPTIEANTSATVDGGLSWLVKVHRIRWVSTPTLWLVLFVITHSVPHSLPYFLQRKWNVNTICQIRGWPEEGLWFFQMDIGGSGRKTFPRILATPHLLLPQSMRYTRMVELQEKCGRTTLKRRRMCWGQRPTCGINGSVWAYIVPLTRMATHTIGRQSFW